MKKSMAIIGMEAVFGSYEGLQAFECGIYDSLQHFIPFPSFRLHTTEPVDDSEAQGSYLSLSLKERIEGVELFSQTINAALKDANLKNPRWENMALLTVSNIDLSALPLTPKVFSKEVSTFTALQHAERLLAKSDVEAVVIGAVYLVEAPQPPYYQRNTDASAPRKHKMGLDLEMQEMCIGEGAGAVVVKLQDQAQQKHRIYCVIEAVHVEGYQNTPKSFLNIEKVASTCRQAYESLNIVPSDIGYIEVSSHGIKEEDQTEILGLSEVYGDASEKMTCALGSVKANIGHTLNTAEMASLIKVSLCLYHRFLPGVPQWAGPRDPEIWKATPFYVPAESRTWYVNAQTPRRIAALNTIKASGVVGHVVVSEDSQRTSSMNHYLAEMAFSCLPIAGDDSAQISAQLTQLKQRLESRSSLKLVIQEAFSKYQKHAKAPYTLALVGETQQELLKEIQFMLKGIDLAFEKKAEWKTPRGSYFTANPLSAKGKIAFVYPGVGSAYIGLGQDLFHMCPPIYDAFSKLTPDVGGLLKEQILYPRTRRPLTEEEVKALGHQLRRNIASISECGIGFSVLYTLMLRECFGLKPHSAFGYSMGEAGMLTSLGAWVNPGQLSHKLKVSPTFTDRLSGSLEAVREHWNLNGPQVPAPKLWECFTVQTSPQHVLDSIKGEARVYMTLINTPNEVVIAGDPQQCLTVIERLQCKHFPLRLPLAIHCGPTHLEYQRLVDLYSLPVFPKPDIKFYSSSCYQPIPFSSHAIAHSIAKAFCDPVDFPRLIHHLYHDEHRIFIEMGAGQNCCNWIDEVLKDKEHIAIPMNVKGQKDQSTLVRTLAKLLSHRVPVNLEPLYS
ncbi:PfaB family protein [Deltaproteobacteria bacterium TL4]